MFFFSRDTCFPTLGQSRGSPLPPPFFSFQSPAVCFHRTFSIPTPTLIDLCVLFLYVWPFFSQVSHPLGDDFVPSPGSGALGPQSTVGAWSCISWPGSPKKLDTLFSWFANQSGLRLFPGRNSPPGFRSSHFVLCYDHPLLAQFEEALAVSRYDVPPNRTQFPFQDPKQTSQIPSDSFFRLQFFPVGLRNSPPQVSGLRYPF